MNGKQHLVVLLALLVSLPPHAAAAGKPRAPDWKKPTDALLACAESRDKPCIEEAVETLVALGSGADPAIRALLTSDNEVAVEAGLQVLARTGLQGAADFAAGLLGGEDYDFKAPVAEALGAFRGPGIVRALTGVAGSPRPFEREKAVEALGRIRDPEAIPALVDAARDKFFSVRIKACEAMGSFDDPRVLAALGAALTGDGNSGVRIAAARALGATKSQGALPFLVPGLKDESFGVQTSAWEALTAISGVDLGTSPDDWKSWLESRNR